MSNIATEIEVCQSIDLLVVSIFTTVERETLIRNNLILMALKVSRFQDWSMQISYLSFSRAQPVTRVCILPKPPQQLQVLSEIQTATFVIRNSPYTLSQAPVGADAPDPNDETTQLCASLGISLSPIPRRSKCHLSSGDITFEFLPSDRPTPRRGPGFSSIDNPLMQKQSETDRLVDKPVGCIATNHSL